MDKKAYLTKTLPFSVTLTCGEELKGTYLPNYLNGRAMDALESRLAARSGELVSESEVAIKGTYSLFIDHLVLVLASIDLTDDGKPVPFKTDKDKREALEVFSSDDVSLIMKAVQDAVAAPLGRTGTDSSDGPQQPEE